MTIVGIFIPGMVSVWIKHKRNAECIWNTPKVLFEYGIYVLINVFLTGCMITYALGMPDVTSDALNSFPFFTKYILIAVVMAVLVPYVEEIIKKYFQITLVVRTNDEKRESCLEDN